MPKPFDVTMKYLFGMQPAAWLDYLGLHGTGAELLDEETERLDTDLSTVSAAADMILRVKGPSPCIGHIEFQSSADSRMDSRVLRYNVLLGDFHDLPVESTLILLRKEADTPAVMGSVKRRRQSGETYLDFTYRIVRVWERPAEEFLTGATSLIPLAPLAAVGVEDLPEIVRRMQERISTEVPATDAHELWTATFVLMGLRYDRALAVKLIQGVQGMQESVTYQWIIELGMQEGLEKGIKQGLEQGREQGLEQGRELGLEAGKLQEARDMLLRIGRRRLGDPQANTVDALQSIVSLQLLEDLAERILDVESWDDLLSEQGE